MTVFAYLDAGTGSLIMQALLAGAAGVAVLWKTTSRRFRRKRVDPEGPVAEEVSASEEPAPDPSD